MIHIYTHSHCALCLSLNFTFPQIVYISHVKAGEITHCLILWSLTHWEVLFHREGAAAFLYFFTESFDGIWHKLGLFLRTKIVGRW